MDSVLKMLSELTDTQVKDYNKNLMANIGGGDIWLKAGKGVWLEDQKGKKYIDCSAQGFAMNLGFANEEVCNAVCEYMSDMTHIMQFYSTKARAALVNKLGSIAPKNLNKVSFTVGGGPAVEAAMKIAMKNRKGSRYFISLWDAYHGGTLTTLGATFTSTQSAGGFLISDELLTNVGSNFIKVPNPYCYRCHFGQEQESCNNMCAEMLKMTIEKGVNGPVAGVIVEPIQGGGGQIPCPEKYLKRVREICDEQGILLIFDEILTFCRVGKYFAAEHYGVEPDIIILSKGLGAGFPLSAIIVHDKLEGFENPCEELHTFSNVTISQVASLKQFEIIERDHLLERTVEMGKYIAEKLEVLKNEFDEIGDIRQVGMHIGVELVENSKTKKPLEGPKTWEITGKALGKGVILQSARGNVIKIKPPLIITKEVTDQAIDTLAASMREVLRT